MGDEVEIPDLLVSKSFGQPVQKLSGFDPDRVDHISEADATPQSDAPGA